MAMIAVIRLKGRFSISPTVESTLSNLKLNRLYSCALLPEGETSKGMLQACKDFVSYGPVEKESIAILLSRRGRTADGKKLSATKKPEEIQKLAGEIASSGKKLSGSGLSPVFFLSPPVGGFGKRKAHVPFGPVGKNPGIAGLIASMA